jgi:glycosyltransferase involved in cell wall biosynthesis
VPRTDQPNHPRWLVERLRRRRSRPVASRVTLVGGDAAVAEALRAAGADLVSADAGPDVAIVLDPTVPPLRTPRAPLRIGIVGRGGGPAWAGSDAIEDADGLVVAATEVAHVHGASVLDPVVADDAAAALTLARDLASRPRLHLVTGVSNLRMRPRWGDHHFAVSTARALGRRGWLTRSWCQAELPEVDHDAADAVLLLAGGVDLTPVPGRPTVAWLIYPRQLDVAALRHLDHVHVASSRLAATLAADGVPATPLLQATDPSRFRPVPGGPHHELLYVANSRNVHRRIPDDLLPTDHELAIYGLGWTEELVDTRHVVGDHVRNVDLPAYYTAADVVLNDHWDDMRDQGFLSNRLYDASACGTCVVTDHVDGLEAVFGDAVRSYRHPEELRTEVAALLADPARRRDLGDRARETVLAHHTFDDRVDALLSSWSTGGTP